MSDSRRHSTATFTPYSILRPETEAVPSAIEKEFADLSVTTPIEESSRFAEFESQEPTEPLPVQQDHLSAGLVEDEDKGDWITLLQDVSQVAVECLSELHDDKRSPEARFERFLTRKGKKVFQLIRDLAWSAAVYFEAPRARLKSWRGSVEGNMSEWRLSELYCLYGAIGNQAKLLTTDYKNKPTVSARQEFICRVHLLRVLYRHAEGKDSENFGNTIRKLCESYPSNPSILVDEVIGQAERLRILYDCTRKVNRGDLQPGAFSKLLHDLSNATKHAMALSVDGEKLFFDYDFPDLGFIEGCWPKFRPAVVEWMKASRLDSLWVATAERPDGRDWIMWVDRRSPTQSRVERGSVPIKSKNKYVVYYEGDHYVVAFPFLENLTLPEEL